METGTGNAIVLKFHHSLTLGVLIGGGGYYHQLMIRSETAPHTFNVVVGVVWWTFEIRDFM